MPSKLIRVTINRMDPHALIVEYGRYQKLTPAEETEMADLASELMEYSDFEAAEKINDAERVALSEKKKRFEQLEAIKTGSLVVWEPQEPSEVNSVLLMNQPNWIPVYVENLPNELFEKLLLNNQVTLNVTQGSPTVAASVDASLNNTPVETATPSGKVNRVRAVVSGIQEGTVMSANQGEPWLAEKQGTSYIGLVYVSDKSPEPEPGQTHLDGLIYAWPVKYLKDDWEPVNKALKNAFGNDVDWVRTDPGKWSHWRISV